MEVINHILLFISLSSLLLSANAVCVPRKHSDFAVSTNPSSAPALHHADVSVPSTSGVYGSVEARLPHADVSAALGVSGSVEAKLPHADVSAEVKLPHADVSAAAGVSGSVEAKVSGSFSPILHTPPTANVNPAVHKVCGITKDPVVCATTIIPFLSGEFEPASILVSEIQAAISFTNKTIAKANELATHHSTSNFESQCIEQCQENYDSALNNFQTALVAIKAHDAGRLNSVLSAAITDADTCNDGFSDAGIPRSLLGEANAYIHLLGAICLDISTLLH